MNKGKSILSVIFLSLILVLSLVLVSGIVSAAVSSSVSVTKSGTVFSSTDFTGADESWSNPSRAIASDNSYATSTITGSSHVSYYLKSTGFGFSIPTDATINGIQVATGSRTATTYGSATTLINVSNYSVPYQLALWLKRNASGCTAYDDLFKLQQAPTKMVAVKNASVNFVDIAGNNIDAGLTSYSTSSTLDKQLALMTVANQNSLKTAINSLNPTGSTCIQCGLQTAADELTSIRGRPTANKVIILLTDGISNVGDPVAGSVYCRDNNITVYTIGFGSDVDDTELTNVALLTHGDYYFAPNVQTLNAIFQSIGKH